MRRKDKSGAISVRHSNPECRWGYTSELSEDPLDGTGALERADFPAFFQPIHVAFHGKHGEPPGLLRPIAHGVCNRVNEFLQSEAGWVFSESGDNDSIKKLHRLARLGNKIPDSFATHHRPMS